MECWREEALEQPKNKIEKAREELIKKLKEHRKKHYKNMPTNLDFYIIGKMLGRGAFGTVNLCVHKLSKQLVAIKSLPKKYLESESNTRKLQNEISILKLVKHNNVIRLYETFTDDSFLLIVIELASGGDLLSYVRKRRKLTEPIARVIFKQILDGINHCHSKGVIHRDIKLDNVLLNSEGEIKICDFGVSRRVGRGQLLKERCGTPAYIAPEVLRGMGYEGTKVDVWSAGVVLYAMLYGNFPFRAQTVEELEREILTAEYPLTPEISEDARDLLSKILTSDPFLRFTTSNIMNHPWMQDLDPSIKLFTEEEKASIRREFDYTERLKELSSTEMDTSIFTVHNLNTIESAEEGLDLSKSLILAPFNSNEKDPKGFVDSVSPLAVSKKTIKFCSKLRDFDRQYERNNNSQLDNGVYMQNAQIGESTKGDNSKLAQAKSTTATSTHSSSHSNSIISNIILTQMESMGFIKSEVVNSLNSNEHNSATSCYYLLLYK